VLSIDRRDSRIVPGNSFRRTCRCRPNGVVRPRKVALHSRRLTPFALGLYRKLLEIARIPVAQIGFLNDDGRADSPAQFGFVRESDVEIPCGPQTQSRVQDPCCSLVINAVAFRATRPNPFTAASFLRAASSARPVAILPDLSSTSA
jgi:hypothetical protein